MKNTIKSIVLSAVLVSCLGWTTAFAAQQQMGGTKVTNQPNISQSVKKNGISPVGPARADTSALICASLSSQINKDKAQLRDVLGYMTTYDCEGAGAGTTQCNALATKKANLEARIGENVRAARDRGCTS